MNYVEKPMGNLTAAHLQLGKINHPQFKSFGRSYFIVEHEDDKEFVSKQIRQLYVAGCRGFGFYGMKSNIWHNGADSELIMLHPENCDDNYPCTYEYESINELVDDIYMDISERAFVPFESYLFYDDRDIYEIAIRNLVVYEGENRKADTAWTDVEVILYDGAKEEIDNIRCPVCSGKIYYRYADTPKHGSIEYGCKRCGLVTRAFGGGKPNCIDYFGMEYDWGGMR